MKRIAGEQVKTGGEVVTMWIPTPSMTLLQRMVLYGTCVVALMNTVGLLVLLVRQNQEHLRLEQTDARLSEVEQSSVVEFFQEVSRGTAVKQATVVDQPQYQYSRNKRSEMMETDKQEELLDIQQVDGKEVRQQAVGEETEKKKELESKHRHQSGHQAHVEDDMMTMMTYSMVPVR